MLVHSWLLHHPPQHRRFHICVPLLERHLLALFRRSKADPVYPQENLPHCPCLSFKHNAHKKLYNINSLNTCHCLPLCCLCVSQLLKVVQTDGTSFLGRDPGCTSTSYQRQPLHVSSSRTWAHCIQQHPNFSQAQGGPLLTKDLILNHAYPCRFFLPIVDQF
ncbi:hypothetical protein B0H34DRAFT_24845 [Crassisporium funariophilum]|nr:hypothetical protein B0H34DRAFT_24845 [Crassisporium funariophilum]